MNTTSLAGSDVTSNSFSLNHLLLLLARILMAAMFVAAGFSKISGFEGTAGYISSVGLPLPELLTLGTIALEIGAGLAIILGVRVRWAALALAGFTLLAGFLFHNFWAMPADQAYVQQLMFMKNLSIAGGLIALAIAGAGQYALTLKH